MSVLQLRDVLLFGVPLVLSSTLLGLLHWFPWNGGSVELTRMQAYTTGTLVVVGVPVAAMLVASAVEMEAGQLFWAALLVANTVVSGATVKVAYWIDSGKAIGQEEMSHGTHLLHH